MRGGARVPYITTGRGRAAGCREGGGGRGLSPHSGLLRLRRGPRGGRTQGCEQHGPPKDEVPLRREGARVRARGGHGVLQPPGRAKPGPRALGLSGPASPWLSSSAVLRLGARGTFTCPGLWGPLLLPQCPPPRALGFRAVLAAETSLLGTPAWSPAAPNTLRRANTSQA